MNAWRLVALAASLTCVCVPALVNAQHGPTDDTYITPNAGAGRFPLAVGGRSAPLYVSGADHRGVLRAA